MILVIDSNIIISALIKDSISRKILLHPKLRFFIPEHFIGETYRHLKIIAEKAETDEKNIEKLLNEFKERIRIVPKGLFESKIKAAEDLIGTIDADDVPFIALALAIPNDGIWSNDKHFSKQKEIKIWATAELMKLID